MDKEWVQRTFAPSQVPIHEFCVAQVEQTKKRGAVRTEKLDQDLKNYRSNSIKDSIRRGYVRYDLLDMSYAQCERRCCAGRLCRALHCVGGSAGGAKEFLPRTRLLQQWQESGANVPECNSRLRLHKQLDTGAFIHTTRER